MPNYNDDQNVMTSRQNISYLKTFYSDFIVISFSLLLLIVVVTIGSIVVTGDTIVGMIYGPIGGLAMGLFTFYYLRGQFNFIWSFLQLIANTGLTVGEFLGASYLLIDNGVVKISFSYFLIFISVPTFIAINKQLLDSLTKKLNAERRLKQPLQIL